VTGFWCATTRDVLKVSGDDAFIYLQGQISQDISQLGDGESTYTLVLQPTGKVEALARLTRRSPTEFIVDTDAGWGEPLLARLNRFRIRVKVDLEPLAWRCIAVRDVATAPPGSVRAWGRDDAFDLLGENPVPPEGLREGTADELDRARIEAGWPAMGAEITEATIPAETAVSPFAVSFTKGCYPGQELVERMDSRGSTAPRFVRRLRGRGAVATGDSVMFNGRTVGALTSVANHAEGWVALAVVARAAQAGDVVEVTSASAPAGDGAGIALEAVLSSSS
jgi:tRNA-modifying protein YgfZ